jgi:pilus assembly protein CpaB
MFTNARRDLDGPPFALPALLDRIAERWWRARPRTRVLLGLSCAVLLVVAGVATAGASPHGPPTSAWVAVRDLPVGHPLGPDDLRRATWPADLLPDGALAEPDGMLVAPLPRGAVATDRHLGDGGLAAGLPSGTAVVPIPVDAVPALPRGALIDLVAADLGGGPGQLVAAGALVLQTDELAVWLAVDAADAPGLASAALHGSIGVVVVPP